MKVVVSCTGNSLEAQVDPRFGRSDRFIIVEADSMDFEVIANPAVTASQGAGIGAAQAALDKKAEVCITGHVGPNAFQVLKAAGVGLFNGSGLTVRQAVELYKQGKLSEILAAGPAKAGMGNLGMRHQHGRK